MNKRMSPSFSNYPYLIEKHTTYFPSFIYQQYFKIHYCWTLAIQIQIKEILSLLLNPSLLELLLFSIIFPKMK